MVGLIRQGIATTQFFLFGKKNCTQTGYLKHMQQYKDPVQSAAVVNIESKQDSDGVDLTGKTFLITGANQGIGKEIATYAAAKGGNVYILCRNEGRAKIAQKDIQEKTKNKVNILLADVGEPSHIERVVKEFTDKEDKLDCLVCNAGALFNDRRVNSNGQEVTFMSHLVCGSYQLTKLLLPSLKQSPANEARVVYVSSGGMYNSKFPEWEVAASSGKHESDYNGNIAYSYAKRGQVLLAERFTKDYPEVAFVSTHPGWVRTAAVDGAYGDNAKYLEPFRNLWEGSEGIAWLTATPKKNLESGAFYLDRSPQRKHIAGLFMTDGSFTKNSEKEVDVMMKKLEECVG
eukprot:CAMPEP_0113418942 /NCGR_PEP_ID=MMETSP0013_2-20120614/26493_1 /TAXON_ID=2843 ORGANISM="Skeletonema costatum, Strain 1716" /NCGR_SAMPLE_ID=MMETSP0013_2 /ASSEMBLY_ACC=CAM_ASM_000158 /LENGTH=344 /DNA_ID=CAMNT_0000306247 /DNA_START=138 /DNA_END=1169 /DNA_ORIENTATION=- /assembly_acc=CAM_ASM_000158